LAAENNLLVEQMAVLMSEIKENRENQMGKAFYDGLIEFQYKSLQRSRDKSANAVVFKPKHG